MKRGQFITLEGGEGVGKSTGLNTVLNVLQQAGIEYVATREPGGTTLGEKLRSVLLDPNIEKISDEAELLMMFAARAEHIAKVIEPTLAAGKWLVSDRFTDATYAYQGGGRAMTDERISIIEAWVQDSLQPDLTLLLDAPVEVGMQRAQQRGALDRFEQENITFFNQVRRAYLQRASAFPQRFRIVSADADLDCVQASICSILAEHLSTIAADE